MDPELVEILVRNVENEWARFGRPYPGTHVGQALRSEFLTRGLPTGLGAYKQVIAKAVESGRIRRVMEGKAMFLQPAAATPTEDPAPGAPSRLPLLGLPEGGGYLRREIFDAFTGRFGPAWLDLRIPPEISLHSHFEEGLIQVVPVGMSLVADAWEEFAQNQQLSTTQREVVASRLRDGGASVVWGKIDVPGDNPRLRLSIQFWRLRLSLLAQAVRAWFHDQGKDADNYILMAPPLQPDSRRPERNRDAGLGHDKFGERLRSKLHRIIDQMSVGQLCELRIPAEFLEE